MKNRCLFFMVRLDFLRKNTILVIFLLLAYKILSGSKKKSMRFDFCHIFPACRRVAAVLLPAVLLFIAVGQVRGGEGSGQVLPASEFLERLREPLRTDTWGEITGKITYVGPKHEKKTGDIRIRITFTPDSMYAQITLNDVNVYGFEQNHAEDGKVTTALDFPEDEQKPGLFEFGLSPEDLTFSFIYWDFLEELPRRRSRLNECRVMKLADPKGQGTVQVWFSAEYGFPMEAWWYRPNENKPWRKLELKGAKRYENSLWFVKEMRLDGDDWKTRVVFDFAQLKTVGGGE